MEREADVSRRTRETAVRVRIKLDGRGASDIATGIGMLDHLLAQLARFSLFDLEIQASGDVEVDPHHTVEDVAITLGEALKEALGEKRGIVRTASAIVPMDDALALAAVDLGGRGYGRIEISFDAPFLGRLPTELIKHFLESFAREGRFNLHVLLLGGWNSHHKAEAVFKALGKALGEAARIDPRVGDVPSTKGIL